MPKSAEARRDPYPPDVPSAGWGYGSAYTCIYEYVEGNITVNKKLCLSTAALTLTKPLRRVRGRSHGADRLGRLLGLSLAGLESGLLRDARGEGLAKRVVAGQFYQ